MEAYIKAAADQQLSRSEWARIVLDKAAEPYLMGELP